jgi:hypothetical protein
VAVLRAGVLAVALACIGGTLAGCSTTYQLGGLWGKAGDEDRTAAVTPVSAQRATETDLAYAKAAAAELLAGNDKDASLPWENPRSGARGTVTRIASTYSQEGATCQAFLASYIRGEKESWYQGGACQARGKWEVRDLRPLQRT